MVDLRIASDVGTDLRVALRRLRRTVAFTSMSIVVLGCGIGVSTTMFNIVNGGVFKGGTNDQPGIVRLAASTWSASCYCMLPSEAVAALAASPPHALTRLVGSTQERSSTARLAGTSMTVHVESVSGPYFASFGARPVAGRLLNEGDDRADTTPAAVISERLWRTRLGGDPAVVGTTAYVAGQLVIVSGVVGSSFQGFGSLVATDVWVTSRVLPIRHVYGWLSDGVTLEQANTEIRTRYPIPSSEEPNRTLEVRAGVLPSLPARFAVLLGVALLVNGLVLVAASASVTLMLVARVLENQADISLRLMLGGNAWQIARLWAVEVTLIAGAASITGIILAAWLANAALGYLGSVSGVSLSALDSTPDWRVALYVMLLTAMAAAGIVVTITGQLLRLNNLASTSGAMGMGGATAKSAGIRGRLIATQVAIATTLLLTAAFLMRSVGAEIRLDPGFEIARIAVGWINQSGGDTDRVQLTNRRVLESAKLAPGSLHAALTTRLFDSWSTRVRSDAATTHLVAPMGITAEFFDVLQMRATRGRGISASDDLDAAPVAVVSERTAMALWPDRDPVGRRFWLGTGTDSEAVEVVGVVPGIEDAGQGRRTAFDVYLPYSYAVRKWPISTAAVVVLAQGPAEPALPGLRSAVDRGVPQAGFTAIRTMKEELTGRTASAELFARALAMLGLVGLLMAVGGLYGLTAHFAAQRSREFGIRKALGATNRLLGRAVAIEGLPPLLKGMAAGALLAVLIGFWLRSRQFPTLQPFDVVPFLIVGSMLLAAGLAGNLIPFHRVLKTEASELLKEP